MEPVEATIERRKTLTVPYHLKSRLTGSIFASAGQADDNIKVGVSLSMGVSASGIPLSPATLPLGSALLESQHYVGRSAPVTKLFFERGGGKDDPPDTPLVEGARSRDSLFPLYGVSS